MFYGSDSQRVGCDTLVCCERDGSLLHDCLVDKCSPPLSRPVVPLRTATTSAAFSCPSPVQKALVLIPPPMLPAAHSAASGRAGGHRQCHSLQLGSFLPLLPCSLGLAEGAVGLVTRVRDPAGGCPSPLRGVGKGQTVERTGHNSVRTCPRCP